MDTTYKLIGTKLYVVQTQKAEVIDFEDISEATLIYIQPELLDSYKVLNPDYSALMKPYSYTAISVKLPEWAKEEPGPGPEPPTPVERFMAHIIPAHEFGMGEDDQRHIAFWNKTRNIGHGEVYNNTSNAQYILQDYASDPDYNYYPTWHVARGDRMFAALDDPGDHPSQAKVIHAWYDSENTRGTVESETIQRQNGYWFQTMEFENGEDNWPGVFFTIPEEFEEEDFIFIINENAMITQTIQNWPEGCENNVMMDQWYGSNEHKYYWIPEGIRWSHDTRAWPEEYKSLELSFYPDGEYHTTGGWLGGPIIVQPSPGFTVTVTEPSFEDQYFTVEILEAGTVTIKANNDNISNKTISYSTDNGSTWTDLTTSTTEQSFGTFSAGDKILFKGTNDVYSDLNNRNTLGGTAQYNVYGNIMSLIYGDNFIGQTSFPSGSSYNFRGFLTESKLVSAKNLILPATTLADSCYENMFTECKSLTEAPELPATKLYNDCYNGMFATCTSLTKAPELPATILASDCYTSMFDTCIKLNYVKCLATNISALDCTTNWLSGVSPTGTFVTADNPPAWSRDENGIPAGWTVETASA